MTKALVILLRITAVLFFLSAGCSADETPVGDSPLSEQARSPETTEGLKDEPIHPLPTSIETDFKKVVLGQRLFNDTRLSNDGTVSCAKCHDFELGGADGLPRSVGLKGNLTDLNSPTVFNAVYNVAQFWDGRVKTLEEQIEEATHSVIEMGSDWNQIRRKLKADPVYQKAFADAYPDGITGENIKNAIAEFERSLITPNSRFDQYLRGDEDAISELEKSGYEHFKSFGCVSCHQGAGVGGNIFEAFGLFGNPFEGRTPKESDYGRFNVTGQESDRFVFKVPSLRNVALTAPYFHDGSVEKLDAAVNVMARYQLGRKLSAEETAAIVAFLRTLNGSVQLPSPGL